jgi:hypothetical protein
MSLALYIVIGYVVAAGMIIIGVWEILLWGELQAVPGNKNWKYLHLINKTPEILLKFSGLSPTNVEKGPKFICQWHLLSYLWRMSKHISGVMVITIPHFASGRKNYRYT